MRSGPDARGRAVLIRAISACAQQLQQLGYFLFPRDPVNAGAPSFENRDASGIDGVGAGTGSDALSLTEVSM